MGWHLQPPPKSVGWAIVAVLYVANWWLIVPVSGMAPFEERFRRWPARVRALEAPFAVVVAVGWIVAVMLSV